MHSTIMSMIAPDGVVDAEVRALVDVSADGLVLVDGGGRIRWLNEAARRALGADATERDLSPLLPGPGENFTPHTVRRTSWLTPEGRRRHLDHRCAPLRDGGAAIWLSDVTEPVRQQERITAITRAAASVVDAYSLRATLDAVAQEIAQTAGIAAVQIHAFDDPQAEVRVLGMAGFGEAADFTERLAACRHRGVRMLSIDSFTHQKRVICPHRKSLIMADPAWEPLHEIMGRPDWDTFVTVPLCVRGRVLGALNAYYDVGEDPGPSSLSFLEVMADHAAVAMDTATLLQHARSRTRSDERRRLARDLHDSAVQQVFSMRMQAEALLAQLGGADAGADESSRLRGRVEELAGLATHALADLRGLLSEMRPFDLVDGGLVEAVQASASGIRARHGLLVDVEVTPGFDAGVDPHVQDDVYRIVQEALHNAVKHALATTRLGVRLLRCGTVVDELVVEVSDDGAGGSAEPTTSDGLGLVSMRERAEGWGGRLDVGPHPGGGWRVRAQVPANPDQEPS